MPKTRRRIRRRVEASPDIDEHLKIEYVNVDDLDPYEFNPRDNEPAIESLMNSIRKFKFIVPIVIDDDNVIGAGHTRWEAARRLGRVEIPCIRASHLSEEQMRQFRIIDNKTAELARWDIDLLADEFKALEGTGIDFTDFGFLSDEVDSLMGMVSEDATAAADVSDGRRPATRETRAPATTRIVIGEFVAFIPTAVYRQWASQVRTECNHDQEEITDHLMDLLGVAPYLVRENGEG